MENKIKQTLATMRELESKLQTATAEEREDLLKQYAAQEREAQRLQIELAMSQNKREEKPMSLDAFLKREGKEALAARQQREVALNKTTTVTVAGQTIAEGAEAQNVQVMSLLGLAEPQTVYKKLGMKVAEGVATDKIIWPYQKKAIEIVARGEGQAAGEEVFDWANFKPAPEEASLMVIVDNEAFDNASFDLGAYVIEQLQLGEGRYLDKRTVSIAPFTGLKSPISGKQTGIVTIDGTWKNLKKKIARIAATGVDMSKFAILGNAMATAILETTPKANGQGGMILENGKVGAHTYIESEYVCYIKDTDNKYKYDSENAYIVLAPFSELALVGHGVKRFVVDPVTLAHKNQTRFIIHTKHSLTNLSTVDTTNFSVFQAYKLNDVSELPVKVSGSAQ